MMRQLAHELLTIGYVEALLRTRGQLIYQGRSQAGWLELDCRCLIE